MSVKKWNELSLGELGTAVKEENVVSDAKTRTRKSTVFEEEANISHYLRALGIYNGDLCLKRLKHMSVSGCAIPCWREGYQLVRCWVMKIL